MRIHCPNVHSKEWKDLVGRYGEETAYVVHFRMQEYEDAGWDRDAINSVDLIPEELIVGSVFGNGLFSTAARQHLSATGQPVTGVVARLVKDLDYSDADEAEKRIQAAMDAGIVDAALKNVLLDSAYATRTRQVIQMTDVTGVDSDVINAFAGLPVDPLTQYVRHDFSVATAKEWMDAITALDYNVGATAAHRVLQDEMNYAKAVLHKAEADYTFVQRYWGLDGNRIWKFREKEIEEGRFGEAKKTRKIKVPVRPILGFRAGAELTKDERNEILLARWAAGAYLGRAEKATPKVWLPRWFEPGTVAASGLIPEGLRASVKSVKTDSKDTAYYIEADAIDEYWKTKSSARRKLLAEGRTEEGLDIQKFRDNYRSLFDSAYDKVVAHEQSAMAEVVTPWYRKNYFPIWYGRGFQGASDEANAIALMKDIDAAKDDLDATWEGIYDKAFDRKSGAPKPPSDKQIIALYKLRGGVVTDAGIVVEQFNRGLLDGEFLMPKNMTMADVSGAIHQELLGILSDRKARILNGVVLNLNDEIMDIRNPLGLAKHLQKDLRRYTQKEYSGHTKHRMFKSLDDAVVKQNWRPETQDPAVAFRRYIVDVFSSKARQITLNLLLGIRDHDGKPLYVAVPRDKVDARDSVLKPETWGAHSHTLSSAFGVAPKEGDSLVDGIRNMVSDVDFARRKDYVEVESPYPSIERFYARRDSADSANIMDAFVGGEAAGILKHLVGQKKEFYIGDFEVLGALAHINAWMKTASLQMSLFFAMSAYESIIAGTGVKDNILWHIPTAWKELRQIRDMIHANDPAMRTLLEKWERAGVEISRELFDMPLGYTDMDIEKFRVAVAKVAGLEAGNRAAGAVKFLTSEQSRWMFQDIFTVFKVWAAERMFHKHKEKAQQEGRLEEFNRNEAQFRKKLANIVNDAYGGQDVNRYSYLTPGMVQFMNLQWFAWNWTLSAWNIAGGGLLTGRILKNYLGSDNMRFVFKENWPAMILFVLIGLPAALQFGIWAAAGGPDDPPIPWLNEEERKSYVDVTPLVRMFPWYEGDKTGKRRYYIRFGKQSYEVIDGWLTEPMAQYLRKWSQPARLAFEMATGKSPGSEWDLEFRNEGLAGLIQDRDGNFSGSRLGYVVNKFLPFSLLSWGKMSDAAPLSLVASVSKGMSMGKATQLFEGYLRTYANDETYATLKDNPTVKKNLALLGPELLRAVEQNGYDPKKVIQSARGAVLRDLYTDFYKALNSNDEETMSAIGRKIVRLNGTAATVMASVREKDRQYNATRTPEQLALIEEAFNGPVKKGPQGENMNPVTVKEGSGV